MQCISAKYFIELYVPQWRTALFDFVLQIIYGSRLSIAVQNDCRLIELVESLSC